MPRDRAASLVHFAPVGDDQDVNLPGGVCDAIDHAPVADAVAQAAGRGAGEAFDVVVAARVALELREAARELAGQGRVGGGEERLRLGREDDLKHPSGPCAS